MKKLLLALVGLFFIMPAFAADWPGGVTFTQFGGERVNIDSTGTTAGTTQVSIDFGFQPKAVRICLVDDSITTAAASSVWMTAATTTDYSITTSALFIAQAAPVMVPGGDGTDSSCEIFPIARRFLVFHGTVSSTLDVSGYR